MFAHIRKNEWLNLNQIHSACLKVKSSLIRWPKRTWAWMVGWVNAPDSVLRSPSRKVLQVRTLSRWTPQHPLAALPLNSDACILRAEKMLERAPSFLRDPICSTNSVVGQESPLAS